MLYYSHKEKGGIYLRKKFYCIIVIICLLLQNVSLLTFAQEDISNFKYTTDNAEITITGLVDRGVKHVVIPSLIGGAPVTKIGNGAFSLTGMESLVMPDTITEIESNAFSFSSIKNITFSNSLKKIGNAVFSECSMLESVTFPEGLTEIGSSVFNLCRNLKEVYIPASVESIGESIFYAFMPDKIKGIAGSYAESYAKKNGIAFEAVSPPDIPKNNDVQTDIKTPPAISSTKNADVARYYPFSNWAAETGIRHKIVLFDEGSRGVKRWEIANILYLLTGDAGVSANIEEPYSDISGISDVLKNRIMQISAKGLVAGYEDKTFRPYNDVTRAEFVALFERSNILGKLANKHNLVFSDSQNHWAASAIKSVAEKGIVMGKSQTEFCPDDLITVQEVLLILDRIVTENAIKKEDLAGCMTDTFPCKQYDDSEAYIIETMYRQFDDVQNKIRFYWHRTKFYDAQNWQGLATYQDLVYALYFMKKLRYDEEVKSEREEMARIIAKNSKQDNMESSFTIRDLVQMICDNANIYVHPDDYPVNMKIPNINLLDNDSIKFVKTLTVKNILADSMYSFPIDTEVTRYMLNYIITKLFEHADLFGLKPREIETDLSKLPYNYEDYPFIIKDIPNEVYEMPLRNMYLPNSGTPKQYYPSFCLQYDNINRRINSFFSLILNVNYQTMDIESFVSSVGGYSFFSEDKEFVREYAQYVMDNKIILEGSAYCVPGAVYVSDIFNLARVHISFKIISADEKKNLLFGDFYNHKDVWYASEDYSFTFDKMLRGALSATSKDDSIFSNPIYTPSFQPVIRDVYYNDIDQNTLY